MAIVSKVRVADAICSRLFCCWARPRRAGKLVGSVCSDDSWCHGGVIGTYGWVWSIATTGQIALDSGWVAQKTECSVAKEKKQTAGLQLSEDLVAVAGTCLGDQRWVLREKRELEGPEDRGERDAVGCWFLDDGVTER